MGVKHLVLTRTWVICSQLERAGKYGFASSRSCVWPRHANSCLQTYPSLPEFNRLMSATSRGSPVVIVSATWQQVMTTEGGQRRESSSAEGQVTWLASQRRERVLVQGHCWMCREQKREKVGQGNEEDNQHFLSTYCLQGTMPGQGMVSHLVPARAPFNRKGNCTPKDNTDQEQEPGRA